MLSVQTAQFHLFLFLGVGGGGHPDRRADRRPDRAQTSDLGLDPGRAPFTLAAAYANLFWTGVLTVVIGLILASAFSAILVYAQELLPGRVGMIAGMFFGFAFGMGGSARRCWAGWPIRPASTSSTRLRLPAAIGLLTAFLPNIEHGQVKLAR